MWRHFGAWVRWACTIVAVLLGITWAASGWISVCFQRFTPGRPPSPFDGSLSTGWETPLYIGTGNVVLGLDGSEPSPVKARHVSWIFGFGGWASSFSYERNAFTGLRVIAVPLWAPFALVALPTVPLWVFHLKLARRRRLGLCSCGYDRRGLVGGDAKCPECGASPRV